jgi:hypothetical protein
VESGSCGAVPHSRKWRHSIKSFPLRHNAIAGCLRRSWGNQMEDEAKTFASNLKDALSRMGWSQKKLSDEAGVDYKLIRRWCSEGVRHVRQTGDLRRIAEKLGFPSVDELWRDDRKFRVVSETLVSEELFGLVRRLEQLKQADEEAFWRCVAFYNSIEAKTEQQPVQTDEGRLGIDSGDCREGMRSLPDESVALTVTSPPYAQMRAYGGHEYTWQVFSEIAHELARVTMKGGVICWVVQNQIIDGSESLQAEREKLFFADKCRLIPQQTIVVTSPGALPQPNRYGCNLTHFVYVLSKGEPRHVEILRDKPNLTAGQMHGGFGARDPDGTIRGNSEPVRVRDFGRRSNVWFYPQNNEPNPGHPARMHPRLAKDLIISFSQPGDLVLDPFAGSGTTLAVAEQNGRKSVGFEIHEPYVEVARRAVTSPSAARSKPQQPKPRLQKSDGDEIKALQKRCEVEEEEKERERKRAKFSDD